MRIMFVLGFVLPFPGAAWTRISFFARKWSQRGHVVDVVGTFSFKALKEKGIKKIEGINVFNIIFNIGVKTEHPLIVTLNNTLSLLILLFHLLIRRPKVVIISVPAGGHIQIGAIIACKLMQVRYIIDFRDEWEDYVYGRASKNFYKKMYKLLKRVMTALYEKSDLVVTVTQPIAGSLTLRGVRRVKIVPNGADVTVFKPYDKAAVRRRLRVKDEEFIIVYEGTVGEYYRLDVVIKALARLDNAVRNKIRLLVVGSGDMPNLLKLAENFGLKDNVLYLGAKNDKVELAQIISAGDVGVIPYDDNPLWKNSVPAKFYEYCACGIPVIATVYDDSLLASIIKEGEVGLTTPPLDEEELSKAILWFYHNAELREVMGRRARMLVEEKFDRNKIADEFFKLVLRMCN